MHSERMHLLNPTIRMLFMVMLVEWCSTPNTSTCAQWVKCLPTTLRAGTCLWMTWLRSARLQSPMSLGLEVALARIRLLLMLRNSVLTLLRDSRLRMVTLRLHRSMKPAKSSRLTIIPLSLPRVILRMSVAVPRCNTLRLIGAVRAVKLRLENSTMRPPWTIGTRIPSVLRLVRPCLSTATSIRTQCRWLPRPQPVMKVGVTVLKTVGRPLAGVALVALVGPSRVPRTKHYAVFMDKLTVSSIVIMTNTTSPSPFPAVGLPIIVVVLSPVTLTTCYHLGPYSCMVR